MRRLKFASVYKFEDENKRKGFNKNSNYLNLETTK